MCARISNIGGGSSATSVPTTRTISTTSPLSGGGDLSADRTLTTSIATNKLIGRGTAGTGVMEEITLGTNLSFSGTTLNASGAAGPAGPAPAGQIFLTAAGGWPSTTAGCSANTKLELSTNKVNAWVLDFDQTTQEYAEWTLAMPSDWNAGTITAVFYWMANDATNNGVRWGLQGRAHGDASALDQAFGTAQEVTDNNASTANQIRISAATAAITLAGTPAASQLVQLRAYRDPANGADNMAADARLLGIMVTFTRA